MAQEHERRSVPCKRQHIKLSKPLSMIPGQTMCKTDSWLYAVTVSGFVYRQLLPTALWASPIAIPPPKQHQNQQPTTRTSGQSQAHRNQLPGSCCFNQLLQLPLLRGLRARAGNHCTATTTAIATSRLSQVERHHAPPQSLQAGITHASVT
jgi:hypothetical protein